LGGADIGKEDTLLHLWLREQVIMVNVGISDGARREHDSLPRKRLTGYPWLTRSQSTLEHYCKHGCHDAYLAAKGQRICVSPKTMNDSLRNASSRLMNVFAKSWRGPDNSLPSKRPGREVTRGVGA
jgi:hypothetical protein